MNTKINKIFFIVNIFLLLILLIFIFYTFRKGLFTPNNKGDEIIKKAVAVIKTKLPAGKDIIINSFKREDFYYVSSSIIDKGSTSTGKEFPFYLNSDGTKLFTGYLPLEEEKKKEVKKTDTPEVLLFTMAFCPYGNQAEYNMEPVIDLLGKYIDFEPHYVIYNGGYYKKVWQNYCLSKEANFCSMHGVGELHQDIRELCVNSKNKDKYWHFIIDINKNCQAKNVDQCWEKIAKNNGININQIKKCQKEEAIDFLKNEVSLNKKYKVEGSPTLIINGTVYNGKRTAEAYKEAICSAFKSQPKECQTKLSDKSIGPDGSCK